jgi:tRNA threonylcarbamoyladenosine biosynthesis protein TsaE
MIQMCMGRFSNGFQIAGSKLITRLYSTKDHILGLEIGAIGDMEDVGAVLSVGTEKGDVIVLDGDLGSGKTCFSRGFIRAKTGCENMTVTSPTYLLSNVYKADQDVSIHHMDLYRLDPKRLQSLNLEHVFKECISLIEWPSRLGKMMPSERLEIIFRIDPSCFEDEENTRYLTLKPHGEKWTKRINDLIEDGCLDDLIVENDE